MNGKRRTGFILAAAILAACTPADDTAEEMPADTAAAMTAPAADVNGTWDMRAVPTSGSDTTPTLYQVQAADANIISHKHRKTATPCPEEIPLARIIALHAV